MWCSLGNTVFSKELVGKDLFTYVRPSLRGQGIGKEPDKILMTHWPNHSGVAAMVAVRSTDSARRDLYGLADHDFDENGVCHVLSYNMWLSGVSPTTKRTTLHEIGHDF